MPTAFTPTLRQPDAGAVQVTKSTLVKDALVQDGSFEIAFDQPAGTVLTDAFVRFLTAPNLADTSTITIDIGVAGDTDSILDAQSVMAANAQDPVANCLVRFTPADFGIIAKGGTTQVGTACTSFSDAERKIYVTVTTSDHTVTTNCDLGITLKFDFVA